MSTDPRDPLEAPTDHAPAEASSAEPSSPEPSPPEPSAPVDVPADEALAPLDALAPPMMDAGEAGAPAAPSLDDIVPHQPRATPSEAAPAILEIRGLTKAYGAVHALRGLDLTVRRGEVYGFLGRNGAGKSTTIRILMGITQKTGGTVALFGETERNLVKARQRIGYVAQEQTFYAWMSPLALARFVRGFYPTWDDQEFRRLTTKLEVPIDRAIGTFSGGMRVKVALAVALSHRPPLLLLDEPTAGLDPVARREFLEIVRDESKASGRTTFFSSHLVDEVELVAHRVGIVDGGKTRYEGGIRELAARVRMLSRPLAIEASIPMLTAALAARGLTVLHHDEHDGMLRLYVEADDAQRFDHLDEDTLGVSVSLLPLEEIFVAMVRRKLL